MKRQLIRRNPDDNDNTLSDLTYALMRGYEISGMARLRHWLSSRHQRNAVFIWIPKNAGTSFFNLLAQHNAPKCKSIRRLCARFPQRGLVTFGHMDYHRLVEDGYVEPRFDESAFKFCFGRNPYERAVSLYRYLINPLANITFRDFCRNLECNGCEKIGLYNSRKDSMCNPQVRWIEKLKLDYVGRVETISSDTPKILNELGLVNSEMPHLNQSHTPSQQLLNWYCDETQRIIRRFYEEDFAYFGYPESL